MDLVLVAACALVDADRRVLIARRPPGKPLAGLWEFPGGKVEPGESDLVALIREVAEELGVEVVPQAFVGEVLLDGVVGGGAPGSSTLRVWWARIASGQLVAHEHTRLAWVGAAELEGLSWIPADRPLLPVVRALLARLPGHSGLGT